MNKENILLKIEKAIIKHPIKAAIAPIKNIGLLPILPINNETGIKVMAIVRNCSDNGRVAKDGSVANIDPTKPVLIILIFVVVIDKPCATERTKIFFFSCSNYLLSF